MINIRIFKNPSKSSTHSSSGPEDSGCGTSSCDEIDVESIETSSNQNLKSSSFSISNLLKEKSESIRIDPANRFESKFQASPLTIPPYTHLYHYNSLLHPLNLFQGQNAKIMSSISTYTQKQSKKTNQYPSFDINQSVTIINKELSYFYEFFKIFNFLNY